MDKRISASENLLLAAGDEDRKYLEGKISVLKDRVDCLEYRVASKSCENNGTRPVIRVMEDLQK